MKKRKKHPPRSQAAIDRQWIRRAARVAKSSGLAALEFWVRKTPMNAIKFDRKLGNIRERVIARRPK